MKNRIKKFLPLIDVLLFPFTLLVLLYLKIISKLGIRKYTFANQAFKISGMYPLRDHYYEPMFLTKHLHKPLSEERKLPGINWNEKEQLDIIKSFHYQDELILIPDHYVNDTVFHFNNGAFETGDAEYWYSLIRLKKPKKIIEIGSGHSTKMAQLAIQKNMETHKDYHCSHICIEPYEMPWLEKIGVEVIRKKVENIDIDFFKQLEENDILFIDSSHIIRPQGDVLFEYLELIPTLNKGVIVHIHDIFSPRDYLEEWMTRENRFWNEQYLLESFLSCNNQWDIICALNFLKHNHYDLLKEKLPKLTPSREPGSFYIVKK